jgi:hypothetical protein
MLCVEILVFLTVNIFLSLCEGRSYFEILVLLRFLQASAFLVVIGKSVPKNKFKTKLPIMQHLFLPVSDLS